MDGNLGHWRLRSQHGQNDRADHRHYQAGYEGPALALSPTPTLPLAHAETVSTQAATTLLGYKHIRYAKQVCERTTMSGGGSRYHTCGHKIWFFHKPGQGAFFGSLEEHQAITHCPRCKAVLHERELSMENPDTPQILKFPPSRGRK